MRNRRSYIRSVMATPLPSSAGTVAFTSSMVLSLRAPGNTSLLSLAVGVPGITGWHAPITLRLNGLEGLLFEREQDRSRGCARTLPPSRTLSPVIDAGQPAGLYGVTTTWPFMLGW